MKYLVHVSCVYIVYVTLMLNVFISSILVFYLSRSVSGSCKTDYK